MAKLAVLAVLASLLSTVSCEFSLEIYALYGYLNPSLRPYPIPPPSPSPSAPWLKLHYYDEKCPGAEKIVREAVEKATYGEKAGLVRLFFHDCFVRGCDASVLLSGNDTERTAGPNLSLRGFEVIEAAKVALEKKCKGVVSCADILAFAGRDASNMLSGGAISYDVPAGRYDGLESHASEAFQNLPPPFGGLDLITAMFAAKGLTQKDMVVLSGGHSIGESHCSSFGDRLQPAAANSNTSMESELAKKLNRSCTADSVMVPQDYKTPNSLDIQYYKNVLDRRVLFNSDAVLKSSETKYLVDQYSRERGFFSSLFFGPQPWYKDFGDAMVKMGNIGVKNCTQGEIRNTCAAFNKPRTNSCPPNTGY